MEKEFGVGEKVLQITEQNIDKVFSYDFYGYELEIKINKNKYDFFELAYRALQKDMYFWEVGTILIKLIPYSKLNKNSILKFLKFLYEKENGTSIHFQITQQLAKIDKNLTFNLLKEFLNIKEEFCIPHIGAILVELHNTYKINQFKTILEYLDSKNEFKQRCVIGKIHLFDLSEDEVEIIFKKFEHLINQSPKIDLLIIYNSYDLIKKGYEYFSEIILRFVKSRDKDIKFAISQILVFGSEVFLEREWYLKLFFSLLNIETSYIANNIDLILRAFLKKNEYQVIEKFLYDWSIRGDLVKIINHNQLSHFIYGFNKSNYFSTFITKALNYKNEKLHLVISNIIHKLFLHRNISSLSLENIKLDQIVLENFDFDDYIYVIRKILGYFYEFEVINNLILSILKVDNLSKQIINEVKGVIINFIGKNYPYDTKQFYKNLNDEILNEIEKEVKYYVLKVLNKRIEDYKKLSSLKEVEPPKSQTKKILRANSIVMNKAIEKARKEDSLSSLFFGNEIIIRYGKSSFLEINGEISDISYLQTFESKVSVPVASQAYPIALELEMKIFRLAKKGDK